MIKKKNKTFSLYRRKSRYWFIVASNTAGQSLTREENGSNLRETLPYERHLLKSLPASCAMTQETVFLSLASLKALSS